ncbi:hypothetical protein JTB14_018979 [Gonioctena quinquepunctata]|nr:hypothetical protein JTB14_018979 [Gonioctena quinquepunctata]
MSNPNEFKYLVEEVKVFHRNLQKDNTERRRDEEVTRQQFNKCKVEDKVKNEIRSHAISIEKYFREIDEHLKSRIGEFHKSITLPSKIKVIIRPCSDSEIETGNMTEKFNLRTAASLLPVMDDLVGPLPEDSDNNRYILTLQCELTKFVEAYPIPNKEAITVAKSFVDNFILRYGIPKEFVTDKGSEFLNSTISETCKLLNIKQLNSTAYHHETIGSLENTHKSLGNYLRIQVSNNPNLWSSWVQYWCFAFNNTVHTETKYTPYELIFGKPVQLPSNLTDAIDPLYNFENYPLELKYRLQTACSDAKYNLLESKAKRKNRYDMKSKSFTYQVGDRVMLKCNDVTVLQLTFIGTNAQHLYLFLGIVPIVTSRAYIEEAAVSRFLKQFSQIT